uniref:OVATE domain-containing protein n=1 Tax=Kalanchoe fedtschenkoi TaxID=63787 RepID=A0A7N0UWP2_KALFE
MVLKKSMNTTHRSLKVFLWKWYRKLPNPFSCSSRSRKQDYSGLAESDQDSVTAELDKKRLITSKELPEEEDIDVLNGSFMNFLKRSPLEIAKNIERSPRKRANVQNAWCREDLFLSFQLESKMRELEKMDTDDVEHFLDIQEVLHYYSRLKTPVYVDIVDKFFAHISSDIYSPHSSSVGE